MKAGILGGAGMVFPSGLATRGQVESATADGLCVALCNHWSYIGIGWQLGIESCVLSVTDAMEVADRTPHVKTCLNLDARAYEFMAEKFPDVAKRLSKYLAEGKVELIGGTYAQPMGTTISGESNIRQIVYGRETIRKALGYEMVTFLEEEEFSHPQIPQVAVGAGYRFASLAQLDTWGRAGIPQLELNTFRWKGKDGTSIPCIPKNSLFGFSPDLKQFAGSEAFRKLRALGKPLIFTWEEFGWEPPDEPDYLKTPDKYKKLAEQSPVEFVTLKEYLSKYGQEGREAISLDMDAWSKLLTWGIGGDQLRVTDRKVEGLLHAAERFDAIAASLGARTNEKKLEEAWKHLLTAQSHDVGLCEYSRWQGDRMAPLNRVEDHHNLTWGAIGYTHLERAQEQAQSVLDIAANQIANSIGSQAGGHGQLAIVVLNSHGWERNGVASTGRLSAVPQHTKGILVKDRTGRRVPSQLVEEMRGQDGNLAACEVVFWAEGVPSVGYDTYYLDFTAHDSPKTTDLQVNEGRLEMENRYLKVKLNPSHGAIVSVIDKSSGREMLDGEGGPFPIFKGTPNRDYPLSSMFVRSKYPNQELEIPAEYDSSKSTIARGNGAAGAAADSSDWRVIQKSNMRWLENGPVRATLMTRHNWPLLKFETRVSLGCGQPYVEVTSRVLAEIPPARDMLENGYRFPLPIQNGYWITFAPKFNPAEIVRDFPLGVEATKHPAFHGLTFVDFVGDGIGLLLLHSGTQYFKRSERGVVSNLLMREWESYWTGEYGWPRYSEYRHALMPHGKDFSNSDRVRASAEFSRGLTTHVGPSRSGSLPTRKSFIRVAPENVHLSAFLEKNSGSYELRLIELEGREVNAAVELDLPIRTVSETNLIGEKVGDVRQRAGHLNLRARPWKILNLRLT